MSFKGETLSQNVKQRSAARRGAPGLVLELECARPLAGPAHYSLQGIARVRIQRGRARSARIDGNELDIDIPDSWMSSQHAELRPTAGGWELHDLDSKNGSLVNRARVKSALLGDGELVQLGGTFLRFRAAQDDGGPALLDFRDLAPGPCGLHTLSPVFAALLAQAAAVAPSRVSVLLRGETGTGKEVLARALHALSGRAGAFVAVNCGAIPDNLVEAELFGHRKGAFSGADQERPGLVRSADGGTLFLDEIGDLPQGAQAALLRVLQEHEVQPVGASRPVPVDLRVLAATHRDLEALLGDGSFRADLLARLDGVTLELPPLRDRPEDVPLLIAQLLAKLAPQRPEVKLAPEAGLALLLYDWPLNVRELEQTLAGALALSGAGRIELVHLPRAVRDGKRVPGPALPPRKLSDEEKRRRQELVSLLQEHGGNLASVARALGKGRTQIVRWVQRYGLDPEAFRSG